MLDGGPYAPRASSALWVLSGIMMVLTRIRNLTQRAELSPRIQPSGSNVATYIPSTGLKNCCRSDHRAGTNHGRGARNAEHKLNHCTRCVGSIYEMAMHWISDHVQSCPIGRCLCLYYMHQSSKLYVRCVGTIDDMTMHWISDHVQACPSGRCLGW